MKNPAFPADNIRQWSQSAQQWQQLAQEKMKDAAAAMQSAQQNSPSRPQQMADATQKAEDILKALEKMQDKASQHMDDLQAMTLSQRLRKVGTQEKEIGAQMLKTAPDTIGLPPGELPEKFKRFRTRANQRPGPRPKGNRNIARRNQPLFRTHTKDKLRRGQPGDEGFARDG